MATRDGVIRKRLVMKQLREITGRSNRTIYNWDKKGIIPRSHMFGPPGAQRRAWYEDELLAWQTQQMANQRDKPVSFAKRARPAPRATVQLIARIDPELKQKITRLAQERGDFEGRIVEDALAAFVATAEAIDSQRGNGNLSDEQSAPT